MGSEERKENGPKESLFFGCQQRESNEDCQKVVGKAGHSSAGHLFKKGKSKQGQDKEGLFLNKETVGGE